jgi:hypothetical protein
MNLSNHRATIPRLARGDIRQDPHPPLGKTLIGLGKGERQALWLAPFFCFPERNHALCLNSCALLGPGKLRSPKPIQRPPTLLSSDLLKVVTGF